MSSLNKETFIFSIKYHPCQVLQPHKQCDFSGAVFPSRTPAICSYASAMLALAAEALGMFSYLVKLSSLIFSEDI